MCLLGASSALKPLKGRSLIHPHNKQQVRKPDTVQVLTVQQGTEQTRFCPKELSLPQAGRRTAVLMWVRHEKP